MIRVAVVNRSTVIPDSDVAAFVPALQTQVSRDFAAADTWGIDAVLRVTTSPTPDEWQLVILDDSDEACALGYHDVTASWKPLGKVFAKTVAQYHDDWHVTASHELLEMLLDPYINLTAFLQTGARAGTMFAYEACDACEDDRFAYDINGFKVSDFVLPGWFEQGNHAGPFDFKRHITKPFELIRGGYISYFDVAKGSGWQMETAERGNEKAVGEPGSRRERRARKFDTGQVVPSTVA